MRGTEVGEHLFTWRRRRRWSDADCGLIFRLPSSLCIVLILNLFTTAARLGVGEEIGTNSLGMRTNTSKCWTHLACACDHCSGRSTRGEKSNISNDYRLEFCSSFPLNEVLNAEFERNRTSCQEKLNTLQKAESRASTSYENFKNILERIDCGENWTEHTYSATSTCLECLEAYKNWICFAELSAAISDLNDIGGPKRSPCLSLCETVLQKCPYLLPAVPSAEELHIDNLVQVGYSAFNCLGQKEWEEEHVDSGNCLNNMPLERCAQNDIDTSLQPTVTTKLPTSNLTTNSSGSGNR